VGSAAGVIALVGVGGTIAALGALHAVPTGLSPLHNAVSQYGITRYRLGYRVATICTGAAGLAAAVGIMAELPGTVGVVVALLVAFGLARLVISWFPMDTPGSSGTPTGRRHGLLAGVAFTSVTLAALRLAGLLGRTHRWGNAAESVQVVGWFMVATLVAMVIARRSAAASYFGAIERGFYVGMLAFLSIVSVALLAH
jgi:hypothetical protein